MPIVKKICKTEQKIADDDRQRIYLGAQSNRGTHGIESTSVVGGLVSVPVYIIILSDIDNI